MEFGGILSAVQSGKCDFAASCITITEERAESVLFSVPNYYGGIAVAVWQDSGFAPQQTAGRRDITSSDLPKSKYTAIAQLANAKIGIQTGQSFDELVQKALPDAEIV